MGSFMINFVSQLRHQNKILKNISSTISSHSRFLTKILKVNKSAMKKFLKKSVVRSRRETLGPATHKINELNVSGVRS